MKTEYIVKFLRAGFEPATYGCLNTDRTTVHLSTNWAIEGYCNELCLD